MININLLPAERRNQGFPVHKLLLLLTYFTLGITLIVWAIYLGMFKYTEAQVAKTQGELGKMSLWQKRYDLHQAQNAEINKRGNVINSLLKNRVIWSDALASLGNITPYGVWLTKVNQNDRNAENISLEGKALKLDQVLMFVQNLQQDPQIASVVLEKTTNSKTQGTMQIISFTLKVTRKGGVTNVKKPQS